MRQNTQKMGEGNGPLSSTASSSSRRCVRRGAGRLGTGGGRARGDELPVLDWASEACLSHCNSRRAPCTRDIILAFKSCSPLLSSLPPPSPRRRPPHYPAPRRRRAHRRRRPAQPPPTLVCRPHRTAIQASNSSHPTTALFLSSRPRHTLSPPSLSAIGPRAQARHRHSPPPPTRAYIRQLSEAGPQFSPVRIRGPSAYPLTRTQHFSPCTATLKWATASRPRPSLPFPRRPSVTRNHPPRPPPSRPATTPSTGSSQTRRVTRSTRNTRTTSRPVPTLSRQAYRATARSPSTIPSLTTT